METNYVRRDGKRVSPPMPNEGAALKWLQKHQGQSADHAIQFEGYDIETAQHTGEQSNRGRYVTEQVQIWIENDGDRIEKAKEQARRGDLDRYLKGEIQFAKSWDAAHHVKQELAWNDLEYRVDWQAIAASLLSE